MQGRENLEQISELLAAFAQVVQCLRGRGGVDGLAGAQHLLVRAGDPAGRELAGRPPAGRIGCLAQIVRAAAGKLRGTGRTQPPGELSLRSGPLPAEIVMKWPEFRLG